MDTASRLLGLSANLRTAERVKAALHYPHSDGRFDEAPQVLSTPCFSSGSHVWEVEAEGCWDIALSYRSVQRKSRNSSTFGHNAESWSLAHSGQGELFACHDKHITALFGSLQSSRIALEVNLEEGRITFSTADSTKTLLHEFKAELTQPVCQQQMKRDSGLIRPILVVCSPVKVQFTYKAVTTVTYPCFSLFFSQLVLVAKTAAVSVRLVAGLHFTVPRFWFRMEHHALKTSLQNENRCQKMFLVVRKKKKTQERLPTHLQ
ncbi:hypothetical protein XENOCAPTIV_008722 [Xenoophorus captivus]|uniref:B30.2/SPRY domain-containing protein n=1 Tax=Xenoophorus captivus TaxID=1517983 RepID=A0ABV0RXM5_9TELE